MAKILKMRNFEVVNQIDDNFSHEELQERISKLPYIVKWAYIVHDKDIHKEDDPEGKWKAGDPVKAHYHIACSSDNAYDIKRYAKDFDVNVQCIEKAKSKFYNMIAYLTHANRPDKYQYPDCEVFANYEWRVDRDKALNNKQEKNIKNLLINSIITGDIKRYQLEEFFEDKNLPLHLLVSWKKAIDDAFTIRAQRIKNQNRHIEAIYISGCAGAGKTTFAKMLAEQSDRHYFVTGSSNDMLQDYDGSECIILDDVRPESFNNFADMLKLLDPNTASLFRSRYSNKAIEADLIILTSVLHYEVFLNDFKEDKNQVYRRIPTRIYLDKSKCYIHTFDGKWSLSNVITNPTIDYIEQKKKEYNSTSIINDFINNCTN